MIYCASRWVPKDGHSSRGFCELGEVPVTREGCLVVSGQHVLVIDGLQEIQEVLRTVLAPRGMRVDWQRSHLQQIPGETADQPDLLIIDAEAAPNAPQQQHETWPNVPQVILGDSTDTRHLDAEAHCQGVTYLPKPFLFPQLIATIERLLPENRLA